jgi:flagellar hook-basal body complex protein FliE
MAIPSAAAANAYASLAKMGEQTAKIGAVNPPPASAGPSFSGILKDALNAVSEAAQKSDVATQSVALGKANMVDVVTAVAESETAVQTLVSVRDKVIAAYEDILKMPI